MTVSPAARYSQLISAYGSRLLLAAEAGEDYHADCSVDCSAHGGMAAPDSGAAGALSQGAAEEEERPRQGSEQQEMGMRMEQVEQQQHDEEEEEDEFAAPWISSHSPAAFAVLPER